MQQTTKYKLNLIERDDPFLPEALNANTQKVEDVLIGKMEGPVAELDGRVTVLEGHKVLIGTFAGTRKEQSDPDNEIHVQVGFRPQIVIIFCARNNVTNTYYASDALEPNDIVRLADDGFYARGPINSVYVQNTYLLFA